MTSSDEFADLADTPGIAGAGYSGLATTALGLPRDHGVQLRGWIVPLAFLLVTRGFRGSNQDFVWYGIAAIATVIPVGASLVSWWNYRYRVSDRDITLKTGIISRQGRVIPFERIQSVDLLEAPLRTLLPGHEGSG